MKRALQETESTQVGAGSKGNNKLDQTESRGNCEFEQGLVRVV